MESKKRLLKNLLQNSVDRVSVIYHLIKLKVEHDDEDPFVILKYKLQLEVIKEISKELDIDQNVYYTSLMKETEDYLEFHHQRLKRTEFSCCLVGCIFRCSEHRMYIRHIQHSHSRETKLCCQYGLVCNKTFPTIDMLLHHIKQAHHKSSSSAVRAAQVDIPCKCFMMRCLGREFANIKALMLHMRNHHAGETVECIFQGCDKRFNNSNSLRGHFYEKHQKLNKCLLKDAFLLDLTPCLINSGNENIDIAVDQVKSMSGEAESISGENCDEIEEDEGNENESVDLDEIFLKSYCDFLNRLANFQFIPQSTIQIIGNQYLENYLKSNESKVKKLRQSLMIIPGISEFEVERVVKEFQDDDNFLKAQTTLNTEYKRVQFLKEKFIYVEPEEIVLNSRQVKEEKSPKAVVHYVNIVETFRNLVQDPSFNDMIEKSKVTNNSETKLNDVKDGHLYRTNSYFKENPGAYTMMLYSDAIELVNPLGAGRGKHKVIQIFFSLAEIPKEQRSKIDRIQLVAVFKEKLIKRFGFKKIYDRLVQDLKLLEAGIVVNYPVERVVRCGVLIHPADNLEAHGVGGFSQCFSSKDICRTDLLLKYY